MIKKLKKIPLGFKSAIVFLAATLFSKGLAFLTTPIFTRLMSLEQIGKINLFSSWYSLISTIVTLSLTSGGFVLALKEFNQERNQYISSILSLTSINAILISIFYFIKPSFWNNITGLSSRLMILMLIGFLVAPASDFWFARQRYEYKYKVSGVLIIVSSVTASVLSIFVVLNLNRIKATNIAEGRLMANYIVIFGMAFIIWFSTLIKGKTFYNKKYWRFSLKLSLPLVGYSVATQILNTSDRIMIGKIIDNSAVGIYGTLYTVSSLSIMVWSALNSSFEPYLYQNMSKEDHKIKEISLGLLGLYGVIANILIFCAPEIVKILTTKEYYESIVIMPPIAAGIFFIAVSNLYSNILVYLKKTQCIMIASGIAAILNVILNAIFILKFGYIAAAYTTLIAYIIMAFILIISARYEYNKKEGNLNNIYDNKKIIIISFVVVICSFLGMFTYDYTIFRYLCIIILIILCIISLKKFNKDLI